MWGNGIQILGWGWKLNYEHYWVNPLQKKGKENDDFYKTNTYKGNQSGWLAFPFLNTPDQTAPKFIQAEDHLNEYRMIDTLHPLCLGVFDLVSNNFFWQYTPKVWKTLRFAPFWPLFVKLTVKVNRCSCKTVILHAFLL